MEDLDRKFNQVLNRILNRSPLQFRLGDAEFTVLACHHALLPAGYVVPEHEHPYYGVVRMEAGSMETFCDGRRILNTSGDNALLFMPQATPHSCRFGNEELNRNLSVNFQVGGPQSSELNARLTRLAAECGYRLTPDPGVAALLREIRRQGEAEDPMTAAILRHLLPAFLALFFQRCLPAAFGGENGNGSGSGNERELLRSAFRKDRVGAIKRQLSAMIRDGEPTGKLARQFGLSPRHLNRVFQRETGMTVKEYQTELRLVSARNLLAGSELPISEVAAAVGFGRPGFFSVFFRRHSGCTPQEYRLRNRLPPAAEP